jgi:hypothetical protein
MGFEPFELDGAISSCGFNGLRALIGDCSFATCQPWKKEVKGK